MGNTFGGKHLQRKHLSKRVSSEAVEKTNDINRFGHD